jgi:hypothetical protein
MINTRALFSANRFCQIAVIVLFCACSKKEDNNSQASTTQPSNTSPTVPFSNGLPTVSSTDAAKALAATDAALKAKQYEQAVSNLLMLQQQRGLTEQQSQMVRDQQVRVQKTLVGAVASGDPKAKAAADMLRAASAHR